MEETRVRVDAAVVRASRKTKGLPLKSAASAALFWPREKNLEGPQSGAPHRILRPPDQWWHRLGGGRFLCRDRATRIQAARGPTASSRTSLAQRGEWSLGVQRRPSQLHLRQSLHRQGCSLLWLRAGV